MFPGGKIPGEDYIYSWYTIGISLFVGLIFGLRNYMRGPQCVTQDKLTKKIAIVTGANTGIGLEIARDLASRGARVILACRDDDKGKAAVEDVKEISKSKKVQYIKLDLASLQSVRDFVETFKSKHKQLHFLVNNAGVMYRPEAKTEDGHEMHLSVNYLGHFLLTQLLLDVLKSSAPSRIIHFTCPAYQLAEINLSDLDYNNREHNASDAFAASKMAIMLFNKQLSIELEGSNVTSNVIHPGVCYTDMYLNMPFMRSKIILYSFTPVLWFLMKGAKDGAQTAIQCLVAKEEEGVSGKFYKDCVIKEVDEKVNDPELAKNLWTITSEMLGLIPAQEIDNK